MTILTYLNLFFIVLIFHFCSDNYSAETRDSIVNEFSSNKNVVSVNHYYDTEDWKNVMDFDVTLKNGVNVKCCGLRFESA